MRVYNENSSLGSKFCILQSLKNSLQRAGFLLNASIARASITHNKSLKASRLRRKPLAKVYAFSSEISLK